MVMVCSDKEARLLQNTAQAAAFTGKLRSPRNPEHMFNSAKSFENMTFSSRLDLLKWVISSVPCSRIKYNKYNNDESFDCYIDNKGFSTAVEVRFQAFSGVSISNIYVLSVRRFEIERAS